MSEITLKTLTLWQPWATLVALGFKQIETRSWFTNHRGPMAIHAAKNFPDFAKELCTQDPFRECLMRGDYSNWLCLPTGAIVAIVELVDCYKITKANVPNEPEFTFGDYTPGRFAWQLINLEIVQYPVPARGRQGLWNWKTENLFHLLPQMEKNGKLNNRHYAFRRNETG